MSGEIGRHRGPPEQWDVIIVGGGVAGLAAANVLAAEGFKTVCVDARPPASGEDGREGARAEQRSTALLTPAIALLERAGVWGAAAAAAAPLRAMRMIDDPQDPPSPHQSSPHPLDAGAQPARGSLLGEGAARLAARDPLTVDFAAAEIDAEAFGWNVPNGPLLTALTAALAARPNASLIAPARATAVIARDDAALVTLEDGRRLRAPLIVGADGRDSFVRRAVGVEARRVSYGQTALAFVVRCANPHRGVSTEIHRREGPFVLVPTTDAPAPAGGAPEPRCSVVWVTRTAEARRLAALDPAAFSAAATERSLGVQGALTLASPVETWPSASLLADRFAAKRVALMAEAAHAAPPIGAQGLNMSLADAAALVDGARAARDAGRDYGGAETLARYERARRPDAAARVAATAALNVAAIGAAAPIRAVRREALRAIGVAGPVRRALMRAGLGAGASGRDASGRDASGGDEGRERAKHGSNT